MYCNVWFASSIFPWKCLTVWFFYVPTHPHTHLPLLVLKRSKFWKGECNATLRKSVRHGSCGALIEHTEHCVIILTVKPSLSPSPPLPGHEWLIPALLWRAACFRAAQSLGLLLFVLLHCACVQFISRRSSCTGRSASSEENTGVLSPELLLTTGLPLPC